MMKMTRQHSMMTFREKVWIGIFALCSLFWMSLVLAGFYVVAS